MRDRCVTTAALVGLTAPHSPGWLTTLQNIPDIDRLVVCDLEGVQPATTESVDGVYAEVDAMLQSENLDFALVSVRNDQAPGVGSTLLSAAVPIVIEKPVARTAAEIAELNDLSRRKSVPWATGFTNRLSPAATEIRRLVSAGAVGRVVSIEGRMVTSSVASRNPKHWLFSKASAGGGILHWLAIHTIDLIRYLTADDYSSVSGHVATLTDPDIDVEDVASIAFAMAGGAIGTLHAAYVLRQRYGDIGLAIRGTDGDISWPTYGHDGELHSFYLQSDAPGWETVGLQRVDLQPREGPGYGGSVGIEYITQFLRCARSGEEFITDGHDAYRAMQFVEAAYAASAGGKSVTISDPG